MPKQQARTRVFVSYSHSDANWLKRLQVHMRPLMRDAEVEWWDDTMIQAGADWHREIETALASTKVAVLLVSADFLASDFVAHDELPALLRAAEEEGAVVIPVIVSPSRFARTPSLSRFQAINPPDQPLRKLGRYQQDEVLVRLSEAIEDALAAAPLASREGMQANGRASRHRDAQAGKVKAESNFQDYKAERHEVDHVDKPGAPEVLALFRRASETFGRVGDDWKALTPNQREEFQDYLLERLNDSDPRKAMKAFASARDQLSPSVVQVGWVRIISLSRHDSTEVRRNVAWDLRWSDETPEPRQRYVALQELLDDVDEEVVSRAIGSLGFIVDDSLDDDLWDSVLARIDALFQTSSDKLVEQALFFYTKLVEKGVERADRDVIVERLLAALDDAVGKPLPRDLSLSPGKRAMHSLAVLGPTLSEAEFGHLLETTDRIVRGGEDAQAAVLDFWADLVKPGPYTFRFKALDDEKAREVIARGLDFVLELLESDSPRVRRAAWSALARFGSSVPRTDHPRVLNRVVAIWTVDRSIDRDLLVPVVEAYVGAIPERMAAEVERYRAQQAERELEIR